MNPMQAPKLASGAETPHADDDDDDDDVLFFCVTLGSPDPCAMR